MTRKPPLFATNVDELTVLLPSVDWMMMMGFQVNLVAKFLN